MSDLHSKLGNYSKTIGKLVEGAQRYDGTDDLARDGLIQRFEFTFELAWKTLKALFENEGLIGLNSPKSVLREAYAAQIIEDEELWLAILQDRNRTAHLYSEEIAILIADNIKSQYVDELARLENVLTNRLGYLGPE